MRDEASEYVEKITRALVYIEHGLREADDGSEIKFNRSNGCSRLSVTRSASQESIASNMSGVSVASTGKPVRRVRVKLLQLNVQKFSGKVHEFQTFWDSFASAIDCNDTLADVDKLPYSKAYLDESTKQVLSGVVQVCCYCVRLYVTAHMFYN